jgi:hypothetical protein
MSNPPIRWKGRCSKLYKDYDEARNFIDTAPIGESDRCKIAYGNAKALYKL